MNTLERRLRFWQDNLVDSGRKNSLLHFRAPYSSCLRIDTPDLAQVFKRLVVDEKSWTIFQPSDFSSSFNNLGAEAAELSDDERFKRQTALAIEDCRARRAETEVIVAPASSKAPSKSRGGFFGFNNFGRNARAAENTSSGNAGGAPSEGVHNEGFQPDQVNFAAVPPADVDPSAPNGEFVPAVPGFSADQQYSPENSAGTAAELPPAAGTAAADEPGFGTAPGFKPKRRIYKDHVQTVARSLYRQSESEFEDRGIRILYLACGMLQWQDGQDLFRNEWSQAPIVLVPIQMSRPSFSEPFRFELADEDVILNPALELKLKNEFSIELPALPDDWEELSLESYLDQVEIKARRLNWRVSREAWLGLFSFHKLVIYQDLQTHADVAAAHPIIQALGGQLQLQADSSQLVDAKQLDEIVPPEATYCVVDADSSQMACIETVKRGSHLVLQGPPGTGKSQTITNMIAESLAAGKSVLFVSEKMAALEVVFERLANAGLDQYCLELHSHKSNKRKVVEHLKNTYLETITPGTGVTSEECANLLRRREALNSYVRALHMERMPIKKSVYDVLAELAALRDVPFVQLGDVADFELTNELLDQACNLARHMSQVWSVVAEGDTHPWHGCLIDSFTLESSGKVSAALQKTIGALKQLTDCDAELAESMGFSQSRRFADSDKLIEIARILRQCPGVEEIWLTTPELDPFIAEVKNYNQLSGTWHNEQVDITQRYNENFFTLSADILPTLEQAANCLSELLTRPLTTFDAQFAENRHKLSTFTSVARQHIEDWIRDCAIVKQALGVTSTDNVSGLKHLLQIARFCFAEFRPEENWFTPGAIKEVDECSRELQHLCELRANLRKKLLANYDESLLELDVEALAHDVAANYVSVWKVFKPGYHKLISNIRAHRKDGKNPARLFEDLRTARELLRVERAIKDAEGGHRQILGGWYRGTQTDFRSVEQACQSARRILDLCGEIPAQELKNNVSLNRYPRQDVRNAIERLQSSLSNFEQSLTQARDLLPLNRIPNSRLPFDDTNWQDLSRWLTALEPEAVAFGKCYDAIIEAQLAPAACPLSVVKLDLKKLARVRLLEQQIQQEGNRLEGTFGPRFSGLQTDWNGILHAITWAHKLRECTSDVITPHIAEIAMKGGAAAPSEAALLAAKDRLITSLIELSYYFEKFDRDQQQGESTYATILNRELIGSRDKAYIADFLNKQSYDKVGNKLVSMINRLEQLRDWIDFKNVRKQYIDCGLKQLCDSLLELRDCNPEFLPRSTRRSLLASWLSKTIAAEPAISQFRAHDHETMIKEFRELDKKHTRLGYSRVIQEANKRRPPSIINQPGSEGALLLREANKSRKHLPLRRLFAQMPNLLLSIKPCFLMSPLSVSQYLDPKALKFDLVIFDEASQIRSEDAVCSIYRGHQLVVCGDNKQLPPTSFFEQSQMADDDAYDEDDIAYTTFDSILDECSSAGIPSQTLRWHYRSKHESLIAFSNKQFYGGKLVTFPSAQVQHEDAGVNLHYVPDGVYDRSGKQCNEREAEVVAQLVMDHYTKNPRRSLGVITFSVAQMNTVRDAIENLVRTKYKHLEQYVRETTGDDKEERFFVKNLERIQGNERDVIIFSVGYGRDRYGRLNMNFGPLNRTGGERRLNVAVTRAREKTLIVSSILSGDFDLKGTNAAGVVNLYHYLSYAEHGIKALEGEVQSQGKPRYASSLESDVAEGIGELGYRVVPQVGYGGYRVDIGVLDPNDNGKFILGIECDGPNYHGSNTARDRDRIRQQVLEGLGWRIHRVWSPDWISRRDAELQRLREALEQSRASGGGAAAVVSGRPASSHKPVLLKKAEADVADEQTVRAVPYQACVIQTPVPPETDLHAPAAKPAIINMLQEVVSVEGPIHVDLLTKRICAHWGAQRAGVRITNAINAAMSELFEQNWMERTGNFVRVVSEHNDSEVCAVRQPTKGEDATLRKIEHIHEDEIREAIRQIVGAALSLPGDALVASVCRTFGYERPSATVKSAVGELVNQFVARGFLVQRNARLQLSDEAAQLLKHLEQYAQPKISPADSEELQVPPADLSSMVSRLEPDESDWERCPPALSEFLSGSTLADDDDDRTARMAIPELVDGDDPALPKVTSAFLDDLDSPWSSGIPELVDEHQPSTDESTDGSTVQPGLPHLSPAESGLPLSWFDNISDDNSVLDENATNSEDSPPT